MVRKIKTREALCNNLNEVLRLYSATIDILKLDEIPSTLEYAEQVAGHAVAQLEKVRCAYDYLGEELTNIEKELKLDPAVLREVRNNYKKDLRKDFRKILEKY